ARFGKERLIIPEGHHVNAIMTLPPEALRLEEGTIARLHKLGLHQIKQFVSMPRSALKRRLGEHTIMRLNMALGYEMEMIQPVIPVEPYQERLPCLEPIVTATGIEIAIKQLLESLCLRLMQEQKGLRIAAFK